MNQQLVVLRETNRALTEQLKGGEGKHWTVSRRPHSNTKKNPTRSAWFLTWAAAKHYHLVVGLESEVKLKKAFCKVTLVSYMTQQNADFF